MLTHSSGLFQETAFQPLGALAPQISTRARDWPWQASAHPKWGQESLKKF